jgi:hypothetical protein
LTLFVVLAISYYTLYRLTDPNDRKQFGPLSPEPDGVRHAGPPGDTGDYRSDEVQGMAHGLATAAATKAKSVIPALRRVDVYQVLNFGKLLF